MYLDEQVGLPVRTGVVFLDVLQGLCYVVPLLGAWLADAKLNRFRTVSAFNFIYFLVGASFLYAAARLSTLGTANRCTFPLSV